MLKNGSELRVMTMNKQFNMEQDSDHHIEQLIQEYDDTVMPLPDIEFDPHQLISKLQLTNAGIHLMLKNGSELRVMTMNKQFNMEQDSDHHIEQLIQEYDDTVMPLPDIEFDPHQLISKVRKHYMEYIIKLLSVNYENNQRLLNKNIYLPSAIWRCAKNIEMAAAQSCMIVQIYRKHIVAVVKTLKDDTKKGKLNKQLYEYLRKPPDNYKTSQTTFTSKQECKCQCNCNQRKRRRNITSSPKPFEISLKDTEIRVNVNEPLEKNGNNPPILNKKCDNYDNTLATEKQNTSMNSIMDTQYNTDMLKVPNSVRMSFESDQDDLMMQMEKLFQGDNDDDLFDRALYDNVESVICNQITNTEQNTDDPVKAVDTASEDFNPSQTKSLDERLATLAVLIPNGISDDNNDSINTQFSSNNTSLKVPELDKSRRNESNIWLCEEYFQKKQYFELLDKIGDTNRKKLTRIKQRIMELFGEDSDDDGILSPPEETAEFVISCKERIAPWVVKLLTPYYVNGRIKGKALFKAVAKHLIRLIYQCSQYPQEYEVNSFVSDFLENHKKIRCEADFMQFRICNI